AELRARTAHAVPDIGMALQRARLRVGMARAELARRVGTADTFIGLVETADVRTSNPSLAFLAAAAGALGVSIATPLSEAGGRSASRLFRSMECSLGATHPTLSWWQRRSRRRASGTRWHTRLAMQPSRRDRKVASARTATARQPSARPIGLRRRQCFLKRSCE